MSVNEQEMTNQERHQLYREQAGYAPVAPKVVAPKTDITDELRAEFGKRIQQEGNPFLKVLVLIVGMILAALFVFSNPPHTSGPSDDPPIMCDHMGCY